MDVNLEAVCRNLADFNVHQSCEHGVLVYGSGRVLLVRLESLGPVKVKDFTHADDLVVHLKAHLPTPKRK